LIPASTLASLLFSPSSSSTFTFLIPASTLASLLFSPSSNWTFIFLIPACSWYQECERPTRRRT
jgi:hypothetical protein